jgi:hypothetical protein
MAKWISCKDRLPKLHQDVFVLTRGHEVVAIGCRQFRNRFKAGFLCFYVTHWQPLPKPPRRK